MPKDAAVTLADLVVLSLLAEGAKHGYESRAHCHDA